MQGFNSAEMGHPVPVLHPIDITGGAVGDRFKMTNYHHVSIYVLVGVSASAFTKIIVKEADAASGGTSNAIHYAVYKEETAGGDTLGALVAATTSGFIASTNDGLFYRIEIDASQLSDGRPNLRVVLSDPSGATFGAIWVELTGLRYAADQNATAIA